MAVITDIAVGWKLDGPWLKARFSSPVIFVFTDAGMGWRLAGALDSGALDSHWGAGWRPESDGGT